jgi:CRISPR/Cas system CMR subunit Cmr6 (Cas7 group RAMP superfamily)
MVYSAEDATRAKISRENDVLVLKRKSTGIEKSSKSKLNRQEKAVYRLYMRRAEKVDKFIREEKELFYLMTDGFKSFQFNIDEGHYGVEAKCNYGLVSSEYKYSLRFAMLGTTPVLPGSALDGKVRPQNGYVMESYVPTELKNLAGKIQEDGGIKSIEINIYGSLGNDVNADGEAEYKRGLENVAKNIKLKLEASGVNPDSIKFNVSITKSEGTSNTGVTIKLTR